MASGVGRCCPETRIPSWIQGHVDDVVDAGRHVHTSQMTRTTAVRILKRMVMTTKKE